ncbi:MAG: hypothetical protein H7123_08195 [Thermoleophilia bacterium]|nr:hypothetical protein [Thermoleophilia bacterium]
MNNLMHNRHGEAGQAIVMAIIVMFLSALIIVGVTVAVRSGSERGSDSRDRATAYGATQEANKTYRAAVASGAAGESTRYVMTSGFLRDTVDDVRCSNGVTAPCWMPDSETAFPRVDGTNIPLGDQITIRKEIRGSVVSSGSYAYWQALAVVPPRFGMGCLPGCVAPGGRAVAYMRAWIGPIGRSAATKPIVTRSEFRAAQFSDYELVADGQINLSAGAKVDGAVHSNGFRNSYQDSYAGQSEQIKFTGVTCSPWARVSVSTTPGAGWYSGGGGGCNGLRPDVGVPVVNLLRANTTMIAARAKCGAGQPLAIRCFNRAVNDARPFTVSLNGAGTVTVAGFGTYSAVNTTPAWGPGTQSGLVLIFNRSTHVSGTLRNRGRATIMTGATSATGTISEPPSIYFDSSGNVGSDGSPYTSVGLISANDIIAMEGTACPLTIRAAMVASGGMLSMDPAFRGQIATGDRPCRTPVQIVGSLSGHLSPYMTDGFNGYPAGRAYGYDAKLFHNPPPLFPTVRNWDIQSTTLANLDCFTAGPRLNPVSPGCD